MTDNGMDMPGVTSCGTHVTIRSVSIIEREGADGLRYVLANTTDKTLTTEEGERTRTD